MADDILAWKDGIQGGMICFVVSALSCLLLSARAASLAADGRRQFWLAIGAGTLSWGILANGLSALHSLTPGGWCAGQAGLAVLVYGVAKWMKAPRHRIAVPSGFRDWSPLDRVMASALAAVLLLLLVQQILQPIRTGDEIRYHASRVVYWIENGSIFPYETHNDRQTYFAYQGELAFLWPILTTRTEMVGRLIFWLATPFSSVGLFLVARQLGQSRTVGLAISMWFLVTPIVLRHGYGLKPEMWLTLFFLGTLFWLIDGRTNGWRHAFAMAGVYFSLSVATKLILLAALPAVVLVVVIAGNVSNGGKAIRQLAAGTLTGAVLSGLAILVVFNSVRAGHPLGPKGMRDVHSAEVSAQQIRTHLVRLPLLLLELPVAPDSVRAGVDRAGKALLNGAGAAAPLRLEDSSGWPGRFEFHLPPVAKTYSLGGLAFLVVLFAGALGFRGRSVTAVIVWPILASLTLGVVLAVRWMVHSGLPERFLIPSFAAALLLVPGLLTERFRAAVLLLAAVLTGADPVLELAQDAVRSWKAPATEEEITEPFTEALENIPDEGRILFFGNQDAPDYLLFGAQRGYCRWVKPWGQGAFDGARLDRIITENRITHILFQDQRTAYFHWGGALDLAPFVRASRSRSGAREIQLEDPIMLLIQVGGSTPGQKTPPTGRRFVEAPEGRPLVVIAPELRGTVWMRGSRLRTPWPIERLGEDERGFLWLGSGENEGLRVRLWSEEDQTVALRIRASAGPSRTDSDRTLIVRSFEAGTERVEEFRADAEVSIATRLRRGNNRLLLYVRDQATVAHLANGDTRRLMAGLRDVRIEKAPDPATKLGQSSGPNVEIGTPKGPWGVETLPAPEHEFLWLGSGEGEGVAFPIRLGESVAVRATAEVSPGPSRSDQARTVIIAIDGAAVKRFQISERTTVSTSISARKGIHRIQIYTPDSATIRTLGNGDTRRLLVGLHEFRVEEQ